LRLISVAKISKFHWLRCQSTALVNLFDKQLKHLRLWQADSPANSSLTKISEPAAGDSQLPALINEKRSMAGAAGENGSH
jgi:hypothetical protein